MFVDFIKMILYGRLGQLKDAGEHHRQGKGTELGQKLALAEIDLMNAFHGRTSN